MGGAVRLVLGRPTSFAAVGAVHALLVLGSASGVIAQGGSTGGSLGKSDQELSGSVPKQAPAQRAPKRGGANDGQNRSKSAAGPKTFHNPTLNGMRVNWCLYNVLNQNCGAAAATAWCRSKGLSRSTDFKYEVITSAIALGDRGICSNFCGAFTVVACE